MMDNISFTLKIYYKSNNFVFPEKIGVDVPHPGVSSDYYDDSNEVRHYQAYYQLVPYVLFMQVCMFLYKIR